MGDYAGGIGSIRIFLKSAISSVFIGTATMAESFKEGIEAAQAGNFETAYEIWLPLATAGNPDAQFNVGQLFAQGNGVAIDPISAIAWWEIGLAA